MPISVDDAAQVPGTTDIGAKLLAHVGDAKLKALLAGFISDLYNVRRSIENNQSTR